MPETYLVITHDSVMNMGPESNKGFLDEAKNALLQNDLLFPEKLLLSVP